MGLTQIYSVLYLMLHDPAIQNTVMHDPSINYTFPY